MDPLSVPAALAVGALKLSCAGGSAKLATSATLGAATAFHSAADAAAASAATPGTDVGTAAAIEKLPKLADQAHGIDKKEIDDLFDIAKKAVIQMREELIKGGVDPSKLSYASGGHIAPSVGTGPTVVTQSSVGQPDAGLFLSAVGGGAGAAASAAAGAVAAAPPPPPPHGDRRAQEGDPEEASMSLFSLLGLADAADAVLDFSEKYLACSLRGIAADTVVSGGRCRRCCGVQSPPDQQQQPQQILQ